MSFISSFIPTCLLCSKIWFGHTKLRREMILKWKANSLFESLGAKPDITTQAHEVTNKQDFKNNNSISNDNVTNKNHSQVVSNVSSLNSGIFKCFTYNMCDFSFLLDLYCVEIKYFYCC